MKTTVTRPFLAMKQRYLSFELPDRCKDQGDPPLIGSIIGQEARFKIIASVDQKVVILNEGSGIQGRKSRIPSMNRDVGVEF